MSRHNNSQSIEVTLPNQIGYERIAMACSASFAQMVGCTPDRIEDLKTVVAEAAINAMQHGNSGRPESRVTVSFQLEKDAIAVAVTDTGNGIERSVPEPNIERIIDNLDPVSGFGLFLIRRLADRVEFERTSSGGHVVRMAVKTS
jgi:serine/threonine-protein kinase RsbW